MLVSRGMPVVTCLLGAEIQLKISVTYSYRLISEATRVEHRAEEVRAAFMAEEQQQKLLQCLAPLIKTDLLTSNIWLVHNHGGVQQRCQTL